MKNETSTPASCRLHRLIGSLAWLLTERKRGISSQQVDFVPKLAQFHGLKNKRALFVVSVEPNSPPWHAGVRDGEFIVAFNGVTVESSDGIFRMLTEEKIGIFQDVTVIRHSQKIDLRVTLVEARMRA